MFENLKNVTIKGGCFETPTSLKLFDGKECFSIIYGRNGSGKSTIAKAIKQFAGKEMEAQNEGYVPFTVATNIAIPDDKKTSVFVFDEDFVRENVRTKDRGLETIVMIGEQVTIDTQIEQKKTELQTLEQRIGAETSLKERFDNRRDISSPLFFLEKIKANLREDGGWADIDKRIKRNTIKSQVTEDVIRRFVAMDNPKNTEEELRMALNANLILYDQTEDSQIIDWVPSQMTIPQDLKGLSDLLQRRIERPELSEREQRLLNFLQNHSDYHLQETTEKLIAEEWPFCPLCLRQINSEAHASIAEILRCILNKESEQYRVALDQAMGEFSNLNIVLPELPALNDSEIRTAQDAIEQLNKDLSAIRNKIEQRKRDIYGSMTQVFSLEHDYTIHIAEFKNAMKVLEECVAKFNRSVNERQKLKRQMTLENEQLTKKRLNTLLDSYDRASKDYERCKRDLEQLVKDKGSKEREIKDLKAQAARTDIALEYINQQLQYVFYSTTKAKLVAGEGCYILKINGKTVPPGKISVGERNVLGLCYFFAKLFSDKRTANKYSDEMLLVIDDPVSSFDSGNKLGVMSLLRHQIISIHNGNSNSRVLVLTHDLRSAFDLVKIYSELKKGKSGQKKFFELSNKQITERKVSNEYKYLVESVYKYATGETTEDEYVNISIGNVMRRLIEAFSSFCYNKGFEEMMCHEEVLEFIPEEKRAYYENFMCRLALNGESHMEEHVYGLDTITQFFTKEEKIQTAKSLLLFLSYVNKEHLSCYLSSINGGPSNKMAVIENWKDTVL